MKSVALVGIAGVVGVALGVGVVIGRLTGGGGTHALATHGSTGVRAPRNDNYPEAAALADKGCREGPLPDGVAVRDAAPGAAAGAPDGAAGTESGRPQREPATAWDAQELRESVVERVRQDPQAARAWVEGLVGTPSHAAGMQELAREWLKVDPEGVGAWLATTRGTGRPWDLAIRVYMDHLLSMDDFETAADWSLAVRTEGVRIGAVCSVVRSWLAADRQKALEYVTGLPAGLSRDAAIRMVVSGVAGQDLGRAVEWVDRIEDQRIRSDALREVVRVWTPDYADGIAGWLETIPRGRMKDEAIKAFAETAADQDVAAAAEWCTAIEDPRVRDSTRMAVARKWMQQDPATAREWIKGTDLPDNVKRVLSTERAEAELEEDI